MIKILFGTDITVYNYIYSYLKQIGDIFCLGAEGGLIIISSLVLYSINLVGSAKRKWL